MTLMVVRLLLVSNSVLLGVVGLLSFLYVERPAGLVGAGVAWIASVTMLSCVHLTDEYRDER